MKSVLLGLLALQVHFSSGQILLAKEKVFNPKKYDSYSVSLGTADSGSILLKGIHSIDIIDARADTFALGYMKKGLLRNYKKIQFQSPGLQELTVFSNSLIIPDTTHSSFALLLVVKELWASEEDTDRDPEDKMNDFNERLFPTSDVKVRFEFYLREAERYFAICRFDTVLLRTLPLKTYAAEYIKTAVTLGLKKVARYNFTNISKTKTPAAMSAILNYNNSRFRLPILNDTSLKKGVYLSFEEFKNNNPSITEFEIKRGKLGDALYIRSDDGKWVVSRSVWGYSEENKAFIKSGDNYYQLHRIGNAYYFNGSREITRYDYYKSRGSKETRYINLLSPLKLDIETGNVY
ncbi:MAG: hypothetical protein WKF97_12385 [Chitinophagaceae bacterium]